MKKNGIFLLILIVLLASGIRFYKAGSESIWFDEYWSYQCADQGNIAEVVKEVSKTENSPPLYHIVLHFWNNIFQPTVINMRMLSVLFGVLTVYGIYLLSCKLIGVRAGLMCSFLMAISPYSIWYSQEIRMYILVLLLCIYSTYQFVMCLHERRKTNLFLYFLSSLAGLYTHYYFIFVLFFHIIYLVILLDGKKFSFKHARGFLISYLFLAILFLPWLLTVRNNAPLNSISWIESPNLLTLFRIFGHLSTGTFDHFPPIGIKVFGTLLFCGLFIFGAFSHDIRQGKEKKLLYVLGLIIPICSALIISILWKPMVYEGKRYLIITLPFFYMGVSAGWVRLKGRLLKGIVLITLVGFSAISLYYLYEFPQKRNWREVSSYISAHSQIGDVISSPQVDAGLLEFYGTGHTVPTNFPKTLSDNTLKKTLAGNKRLWLVLISKETTELERHLNFLYRRRESFASCSSIGHIAKLQLYDLE